MRMFSLFMLKVCCYAYCRMLLFAVEPKDMEGISKMDESDVDELNQTKSIEDAPIKENLGY